MASNDLRARLAALTPAQRDQLLNEVAQKRKAERAAIEAQKYHGPDGIVRFVSEVLGIEPHPYQVRILRAIATYKRVAVRAPHGVGKSAVAAMFTLWLTLAFDNDVKVMTTAPTHRQLEKMLWGEVRKFARRADTSEPVRVLTTVLKFPGRDKEAFAAASDEPENLEGLHAAHVGVVFDEAKHIPSGMWDALEGAFSHGDAYALAISTPGAKEGRFYDIHAGKPGLQDWHTIHVTLDEAIAAGQISMTWAAQRALQWGVDSPIYKNRVEGEFATSSEDSIIPFSWLELAIARWHEHSVSSDEITVLGVDPARSEQGDASSVARLRGNKLIDLHRYRGLDGVQLATKVLGLVTSAKTPIAVDVIGVGASVTDQLTHRGAAVTPVTAGAAADEKDHTGLYEFVNMRAQVWWQLRDALNPINEYALALPDDDLLTGDLVAPRYAYDAKGRIKLEDKDDIRKRLGRSPDDAEALALAWHVSPYRHAHRGGHADAPWLAFMDVRYKGDDTNHAWPSAFSI